MSQAGLADALGEVTQSAVSQWEKGRTEPSMDNLVRMAEILETTADYLAEGKGSVYGVPPKIDASAPFTERIAIALEGIAAEVRHMRQTLDRIASTHKDD
jgi:transcriptional regulator with XRE-family HTH domain